MRYTIQSVKYVLKNFFYIFPFVLIPALFLSFSLDQVSIERVLTAYFGGEPDASFPDIFRAVSVFNFRSVKAFFAGLIAIVSMILCVSLIFAFIEKHMRIGKRTFSGVFSKLNDNLLSTCGICLLYVLIYELWALIASALLFLASLTRIVGVVYVLSAVVFFGMNFVLLYIVSVFYLWLPCIQITGFRAFEALRYSYQLASPVKKNIVFGQWISVTLAEVLFALCSLFVPGKAAGIVLATILFALMTAIFCVRMQVVYFDRAQMERADLKRYYHF